MDRIFYNDIREIVATCQRFGCEPMKGYVLADAFAEVIRKIEELENKDKRIAELEVALKPFAEYADQKATVYHHDGVNMVLLDQDKLLHSCRAARTVLEKKQ